MPELPEVETVRRGLERLVVGKTITAVEISYPRLVVTGADQLATDLAGATITGMSRRGKYLIFELGPRSGFRTGSSDWGCGRLVRWSCLS